MSKRSVTSESPELSLRSHVPTFLLNVGVVSLWCCVIINYYRKLQEKEMSMNFMLFLYEKNK